MAQINKPDTYFNTKLYTGNNNVSQTISGVGFQPDMTWIKCRSDIENHHLADAVRGANKFLFTNATNSERTGSENDGHNVMAFTSDGFSLTNTSALDDELNFGSRTYCSWNWLASNTTASNTQGDIASTVSANTTSGFSIVSYTGNGTAGATVGHGLGVTPKFMIIKNRDSGSENFCSYHVSLGATKTQKFTTSAAQTLSSMWNNTEPTSSVFTIGTDGAVNVSGNKQIVYCFADVKGFSKFGSYTGNGNADGTFVYTGFKPAWVMIKRTDSANQWGIMDNKRNTFNPMNAPLFAEASQAESSNAFNNFDILSNGMKMKTGDLWTNASGGTYIYMAFAEEPLVGDNPATAR